MTIRHHLTDALLMAYAGGQLAEAFSLVIATHISMCDECRARAASMDALGGALLDRCVPDKSSPDLSGGLAQTMALIAKGDPAPQEQVAAMPLGRPAATLPGPLHGYVGGDLTAVKWRSVGMGVSQSLLPTSRAASVRLLRIPAGAAVPDHGHRGIELTLVLRGAFADKTDRFGPGDLEIADAALEHTPVAEAGEPCICLAATDAPLRFTGLLPRVAQKIFRL